MNRRAHLRLEETRPRARGRERGRRAAAEIARTWRTYAELFDATAAAGGRSLDVPELALASVAATRAWAPDLAEEMEGVAEGADVPLWVVAALNARTEILSEAAAPRAGECSTVVHVGASRSGTSAGDGTASGAGNGAAGRTVGGQSWDWHEELADGWHAQSVRGAAGDPADGGSLAFTGITEYGILGKIGLNEAGVGVLFNILGHAGDGAGGVPVHLVARRALGSAASFDEAIAVITGAPVSASTVMTVVTAGRAASVEVSPAGAAVVHPDAEGWLVRTNHFQDPVLAAGEHRGRLEPETYDRLRVLGERVRGRNGIAGPDDLAALLTAHPGDGAEVCCHAPAGGRLGTRWATLATVLVEPAAGLFQVHDGGPCTAGPGTWETLAVPTG
ncbi:C45 family autoproteolytic acyltransferase/hydolase [Streptosporangium sandarakinum]|uniref:C45 family autoproteolytic acyltransferase/hydolase n=1 Tax=Streptosporangium sandarakinum TaxID=1260955 RepID=UPI00378DA332